MWCSNRNSAVGIRQCLLLHKKSFGSSLESFCRENFSRPNVILCIPCVWRNCSTLRWPPSKLRFTSSDGGNIAAKSFELWEIRKLHATSLRTLCLRATALRLMPKLNRYKLSQGFVTISRHPSNLLIPFNQPSRYPQSNYSLPPLSIQSTKPTKRPIFSTFGSKITSAIDSTTYTNAIIESKIGNSHIDSSMCRCYLKQTYSRVVTANSSSSFNSVIRHASNIPPSCNDNRAKVPHNASQLEVTTTLVRSASTKMKPPPHEPNTANSLTYLPPSLHSYARLVRLDKPIGTYLLLHPCLHSIALASIPLGSYPDFTLCLQFSIGAFLMRGAGCTINDMWDSKYDKYVDRTKNRPLASGALTHTQALTFLALQLTTALGVLLSLPHTQQCLLWGVASLPLVVIYPLMKRFTKYPQFVLGLTFNSGAIIGWVAVQGVVDWSVVGPLYASGVAWTVIYDTLYAHQDKIDDTKLGLQSTALTFGDHGTKPILTMLTGVASTGWMLAGYNCGFGPIWDAPYYYAGCSLAGAHLLWQVQSANLNDSKNLAERFQSNNLIGWIIFGSCVVGNIMAG